MVRGWKWYTESGWDNLSSQFKVEYFLISLATIEHRRMVFIILLQHPESPAGDAVAAIRLGEHRFASVFDVQTVKVVVALSAMLGGVRTSPSMESVNGRRREGKIHCCTDF